MAELDRLEIVIDAKALKANVELDKLAGRLEKVASSLININGDGLTKFACSIDKFAKSSRALADVNTDGLTHLMNSIGKISNVDTKQMAGVAAALKEMAKKINALPTVSENAAEIGRLVKNISSLGSKSALSAIDNMPRLAKAMQQLMTTLSKAPQVSQNLITMTTALTDFTKSCRGLSGIAKQPAGTLSGLTTSFSRLIGQSRRATGSIRSFSQIIGTFYAKCFMLIRGVKALGKSIESSMDYIETYNYFNVITDKIGAEFGNAWKENGYSSAEEYSKSFRERLNNLTSQMTGFNIGGEGGLYMSGNVGLGLDPEKIMAYQANISSITNAVGLMGETSVNTSKALTMLAADLSSLKNQDLESVMKNLQSGLIGQSRALYKYGIDITNNTLQTYAYANGIDKAVQEMTQAEKMQLRLLAILDQSKVAYGDMANTISGVANQYRIFKQQMSNLARIIGNLFIPVLQTVLPYINGFVIALQRLFTWIGNLLGVKWENLMDGISSGYTDTGLEELYDNAEDVTGALEDANKAANKLKKTIHSYDELHVASDPNSGNENTSIGGSGGIDLSGAIADALADYEKVWNEAMKKMENKAQEIADKISAYFKKIHDAWVKDADMSFIGENIGNALNNLLYSIDWESIKQIAYKIGKSLSTALSGFLRTTDWREVGTAIAESLNTLVKFVKGAIENFDFHALGLAIANAVNGFFANFDFADAADALNKFVDGLGEALKTFLAEVDWENVFKGLYDFVSNLELDTVTFIIGTVAFKKYGKSIISLLKTWIIKLLGEKLIIPLKNIMFNFEGLRYIFSAMNPGMIGELGLTIERLLQGTFLDTSTWEGIPKKINDAVNSVIDFVGNGVVNVFGAIGEIISNIFSWGATIALFEDAKANFSKGGLYIIQGIIEGILGAIGLILEPIGDFFVGLWNAICDVFGIHSPAETMKPIGEYILLGIIDGFRNKFGESITAIKEWYNAVLSYLSEKVPKIIEDVKNWFAELPNKIYNAIIKFLDNLNVWDSKVKNTFLEKVKEIINGVIAFFKELPKKIFDAIKGFFQKIRDWAGEAIRTAQSVVPSIISSIVNFFTSLPDKLFSIGKQMIQGLINGVQSMFSSAWNSISNFASGLVNGFKSALNIHSPSRVFFELGEFTIEGYENGLKNLFGDVYNTLDKFSNTMQGHLDIEPRIMPMPDTYKYAVNTGEEFIAKEKMLQLSLSANTQISSASEITGHTVSIIKQAVTEGMMNVFMATQATSNTDDNREVHVHVHIGNDELGVATFKGMRDAARRGLIPKFV